MHAAATHAPGPTTVFEDWSDLDRWRPAGFPDGQGGTWLWQEPDAVLRREEDGVVLEVPRFTRSHGSIQIFDNPKHLLACGTPIAVPDEGLVVEVAMGGRVTGTDGTDWRDGFVSFNLMDFENGFVLDGLCDGTRSGALWERLHIPGMVPREQAFTTIAPGPGSGRRPHRFRFAYDPAAGGITVDIDGTRVLEALNVPAGIRSFTPGFGVITLHPIQDGRSTSLRGQGASGWLGPIRVGTLR